MAKKPKRPRPARTTSLKNAPPLKVRVKKGGTITARAGKSKVKLKVTMKGGAILSATGVDPKSAKALKKAVRDNERRDKVSETTWERLYALRDSIREHEAKFKECAKELKEREDKLQVLETRPQSKEVIAESKTLAYEARHWKLQGKQHKNNIKLSLTQLLDLIDKAEDGTLFEGSLKGSKDVPGNPPPTAKEREEPKGPLFSGASAPSASANSGVTSDSSESESSKAGGDRPFQTFQLRKKDRTLLAQFTARDMKLAGMEAADILSREKIASDG